MLGEQIASIQTRTKNCTLTCNPLGLGLGSGLGSGSGSDLGLGNFVSGEGSGEGSGEVSDLDLGLGEVSSSSSSSGSGRPTYTIQPYQVLDGDPTVDQFLDYISQTYNCQITSTGNNTGTVTIRYPSMSSSSLSSSNQRSYNYTVIHASNGGGPGYIGLVINDHKLILLFNINHPTGFTPVGWVYTNGNEGPEYNRNIGETPWVTPKIGGTDEREEMGDIGGGIRSKGRKTKGKKTKGRKTKGRKTKRKKTKRRKTKRRKH
jgi:hypothetical protein